MKHFIITLFFIAITSDAFSQNDKFVINKNKAIQDFEVFENALREGHPGLFWYSSKEEVDSAFINAKKKITNDISRAKLHEILNSVLIKISCGHTSINFPLSEQKSLFLKTCFLDLSIKYINGRFIVTRSGYSEIPIGAEVKSLDAINIDTVFDVIERFIPVDKGIESKKTLSSELFFPYYYALYVNSNSKHVIEIIEGGTRSKHSITSVGWNKAYMFASPKQLSLSQFPIKYDVKNNIALLKVSTFSQKNFIAHQVNFKDTINSIFKDIKLQNIDTVVIDFRNNNGGHIPLTEFLLTYLITDSVRMYKENSIKENIYNNKFSYSKLPKSVKQLSIKYPNYIVEEDQYKIITEDKIGPNKFAFNGVLYFITNGLTFSATSNMLAICQENSIGQIFGEIPGGSYNGCNGGIPIKINLPNSELFLFFYTINIRLNTNDSKQKIEVSKLNELNISRIITFEE